MYHADGAIRGTNKFTPLELRHLRAFRAVMTLGSTVDAARVLGLSQPSISRLIGELEARRGEALFHRVQGRLAPSAAAFAWLEEVERGLDAVDGLLGNRARAPRPQRLTVAMPNGLATAVLNPAMKALLARHPDVTVSLELTSYHETMNAVAMRRADLGVVKEPVDHPAIDKTPLITVGTEIVLPRDHPLAARATILLADLADQPLILLGRHRPFRVRLDEALEAAGIRPRVVIETHAVNVACSFVAAGLGLTLANALIARSAVGPDTVTRAFELSIPHSFCMITNKNHRPSPVVTALCGILRDQLAPGPPRPD